MNLSNITTKFEINIGKNTPMSDITQITSFAIRHKVPAVVVDIETLVPMISERSAKRGAYKIIVKVDFDRGDNFSIQKFKFFSPEMLSADGFDILLTKNKKSGETTNEIRSITSFLREYNQITEIRWTFGTDIRTEQEIIELLHGFKGTPCDMIRTGIHTKVAGERVVRKTHEVFYRLIKEFSPAPIKISGNVDWATVKSLKDKAARFDVSLVQAKSIMREAERELKEITKDRMPKIPKLVEDEKTAETETTKDGV